jgi:citrate lyase subunit beta/citryl-CoA lyase
MLPKVESSADIQISDWIVGEFERQRRLPAGGVKLVPIIETAAGVVHVRDIAVASRRIPYLTFGAGDFSLDTKSYRETDSSLLIWARSQIVIASRLAGLQMPVDTVYPRLDDEDGLRAESLLSRDMGFQGKACIHPAQLGIVQSIFGPDPEVLRDAAETVRVFEEATAKGEASILLNGRLVDYAIAEFARQLLRQRGL